MPGQFIKEFINGGHGEAILYSDVVECSVVYKAPPATVLLFHEENRRREWTLARLYQTGLKHRSDLLFELRLLIIRVAVGFDVYWVCVWEKVYVMSDVSRWW